MIGGLAGAFRAAIETMIPAACPACFRALGPRYGASPDPMELLCTECRALLRPLPTDSECPRCGVAPAESARTPGRCADCEALPATFLEARAAWPYAGPAGAVVRTIKYRNAPFLAPWLAALALPPRRVWLEAAARDALVAAVPMFWARELLRGYNQAQELAQALGELLGAEVLPPGHLLRFRARGPQARFHTRRERLANLADSFQVKREHLIAGRRVLLVDDVMTTGATAAQAAGALMEGGAAEVRIFSVVRARLGDDAMEPAEAG